LIRGAPPAALATLLASISDTTIAQYSRPIRIWWYFCRKQQISGFIPSIPLLLEFLSSFLSGIGSYATLYTYHSAISLIALEKVGSHPLIRSFFKGVAALKPRYSFALSSMIKHLSTLYFRKNLSLVLISRKLVTLLALTSAQRLQTLAAIQFSNMSFSNLLIIKIPARLNTPGIGGSQPLLTLRSFSDKPGLCVTTLLEYYIKYIRDLRQRDCDSLFISCCAPYQLLHRP